MTEPEESLFRIEVKMLPLDSRQFDPGMEMRVIFIPFDSRGLIGANLPMSSAREGGREERRDQIEGIGEPRIPFAKSPEWMSVSDQFHKDGFGG